MANGEFSKSPKFPLVVCFRLPKRAACSAPVAEQAYTVMCGETGILFSFSQLTPLTQPSPRLRRDREKTRMGPQTLPCSSAASWPTHISPLAGLRTKHSAILTPDFLWQLVIK